MSSVKDVGFLLRKTRFSESSLILKAMTRKNGLVSFIIKGARRPNSKFRGLLETALHLEFIFPEQSRSELRYLTDTCLIQDFPNTRMNPTKQGLATVFAEILMRYPSAETEASLFHDLYLHMLLELESASLDYEIMQSQLLRFMLEYCRHSGLVPQFQHCVRCGIELFGAVAFDWDQGGPTCTEHREESGSIVLREATLLWLQNTVKGELAPPLSRTEAWRVENFLLHYLGRHSGGEKALKALPIWHEMMETLS